MACGLLPLLNMAVVFVIQFGVTLDYLSQTATLIPRRETGYGTSRTGLAGWRELGGYGTKSCLIWRARDAQGPCGLSQEFPEQGGLRV